MMEFYEIIKIDNDDIIIEKVVVDSDDYSVIKLENNIVLRKNIHITSIDDLKLFDFNHSKILECAVMKVILQKNDNYIDIIEYLYSIIGDKSIDSTSIKKYDDNELIKEILNRCIKNNISIKIRIRIKGKYNESMFELFRHINNELPMKIRIRNDKFILIKNIC